MSDALIGIGGLGYIPAVIAALGIWLECGKRAGARAALLALVWPAWIIVGLVYLWRTAELTPRKR